MYAMAGGGDSAQYAELNGGYFDPSLNPQSAYESRNGGFYSIGMPATGAGEGYYSMGNADGAPYELPGSAGFYSLGNSGDATYAAGAAGGGFYALGNDDMSGSGYALLPNAYETSGGGQSGEYSAITPPMRNNGYLVPKQLGAGGAGGAGGDTGYDNTDPSDLGIYSIPTEGGAHAPVYALGNSNGAYAPIYAMGNNNNNNNTDNSKSPYASINQFLRGGAGGAGGAGGVGHYDFGFDGSSGAGGGATGHYSLGSSSNDEPTYTLGSSTLQRNGELSFDQTV